MNVDELIEINIYIMHMLMQYLNIEGFLEKSLKIKSALKKRLTSSSSHSSISEVEF